MKFITMNPTVVVSFLTIYNIINIRREVKNFFLIFIIFDIIVFMFTYIMYIYIYNSISVSLIHMNIKIILR